MASYNYKSWQTINLPTVSADTYFRILDHPSASPQNEVEGILYDGLVLNQYNIQQLNEILSQYVNPNSITFESSLQENFEAIKKFYLYYSTDNWTTFTSDDITIVYDWSYEQTNRTLLSDPISDLLDIRQYLLYSVRPLETPMILTSKIGNVQMDSYELNEINNYNYVKYLPDANAFPGEFDWGYSYDYLVTTSQLTPGTYATITIAGNKFTLAHTCYRYCIYYFNQYGGWDSLLFQGKTIQNDSLSRLSYKKNYVAGALDFNKVNYLTTVQESWQLNTSFIDDIHSEKMINLMSSNSLYLHDLEENKIIPINITNNRCEHKSYKNQGRKLYTYNIEVAASQPKYRI